MKSCVLYAWDNHDIDVLLNFKAFYRSLGYRVKVSEKFDAADLLVVLRIVPKIQIPPGMYKHIHLYEYIIHDAHKCINEFIADGTTFVSLDENQLDLARAKGAKTVHSFIPVVPYLWRKRPERAMSDVVHIGNFKPYELTDETQKSIINLSTIGKIKLWGKGWPPASRSLGRHLMSNLSGTYARSRLTIGSMYPHQRGKSYSGRMWHAPLCGCFCLTEGAPVDNSPGLILNTDPQLIEKIAEQFISYDRRLKLFQEASLYWLNQNKLLSLNIDEQLDLNLLYWISLAYKILYLNFYYKLREGLRRILPKI
jgi:hypothetical protein